jgi:hypothetical protein
MWVSIPPLNPAWNHPNLSYGVYPVQQLTPPDPEEREEESENRREYGLDNTLAETFPCSDPLSSIPNPCPTRF